jgi:hypothetical protein
MAMVKTVSPSGWDFDCKISSLVKVASDGLRGNDRSDFIKRASGSESIFLPMLDSVKFAADEEPVHLIALGASEYYGANRNGDGFKEACCKKYHDTFVKFARFFRNHKNKDHKISYGLVKASAYNPVMHRVELLVGLNKTAAAAERNGGFVADKELQKLASGKDLAVSMACFPPGTPVRLADGTEREIELLAVGDKVVTHHGNIGEVECLMTRHYDAELVRFRASGLPDDVLCTSNHKIWVRPSLKGKTPKCPVCGKQFKNLQAHLWQKKDPQHLAAYKDYGRYAEDWVPAEQLTVGDYVRTPFSAEITEQGDPLYAELLGYYLSDGHTFYYKKSPTCNGVDFSFALHETSFADRVSDLLRKLGYDRIKTYQRKNNVLLVRVNSPELLARIEADAGRYSHGKRLAAKFMTWAPETQMKLFAAFMNGDGCYHKTNGYLIATTVSRQLAYQLATICWRNKIPARISGYTPKNKNKRRSYTVAVQESHVDEVDCAKTPEAFTFSSTAVRNIGHLRHQKAGTVCVRANTKPLAYVENGFVYRRIVRVSREDYCGPVHNITVSLDSSYTVNGVAVSNCRVPWDRCSWCGNQARTRDDYCKEAACKAGGCADNLTRLIKMGNDVHMLHVDNPDPTWFDISDVYRPADRTAYGNVADWLDKAASDNGFFGVGSAKMAQDLGVMAPLAVILYQDAFGWNPNVAEQIKLAHGLCALEKREDLNVHEECKRAFDARMQPHLDLTELELDASNLAKTAASLGALADQKILLPLRDFARLTKRAELAGDAAACLKGVYGRMIADGSLEQRLSTNRFIPCEKLASIKHRQKAASIRSIYSLDSSDVRARCMLSTIRGHDIPDSQSDEWNEKKAHDSPLAEELARDYATYKVAGLQRIARFDTDFLLTTVLSSVQNQVI